MYNKDGSVKQVSIRKTKKYAWSSCQFCKDYSAELADISVGSSGASSNDWNSVILRTDIGVNVFNDAVKRNRLTISDNIDLLKLEKIAYRKKTRITQIDEKILNTMRLLDISEFEIKTYTALMSLGQASESLLSEVMKAERNIVAKSLKSLEQREWVKLSNEIYISVDPNLVISNEISKLRKN